MLSPCSVHMFPLRISELEFPGDAICRGGAPYVPVRHFHTPIFISMLLAAKSLPHSLLKHSIFVEMPQIDWTTCRSQVESWFAEGASIGDIHRRLEETLHQQIGRRTLERVLAQWQLRTLPSRSLPNDRHEELLHRIRYCFHALRINDETTVSILQHEGFDISKRTLQRRRLEMGLYKRLDAAKSQQLEEVLGIVLQEEYNKGHIEDWGRGHLYTYLRSQYNVVGR